MAGRNRPSPFAAALRAHDEQTLESTPISLRRGFELAVEQGLIQPYVRIEEQQPVFELLLRSLRAQAPELSEPTRISIATAVALELAATKR